ncbi:hypothetical protein QTP88_019175 [Uroleucon formosanum]
MDWLLLEAGAAGKVCLNSSIAFPADIDVLVLARFGAAISAPNNITKLFLEYYRRQKHVNQQERKSVIYSDDKKIMRFTRYFSFRCHYKDNLKIK